MRDGMPPSLGDIHKPLSPAFLKGKELCWLIYDGNVKNKIKNLIHHG